MNLKLPDFVRTGPCLRHPRRDSFVQLFTSRFTFLTMAPANNPDLDVESQSDTSASQAEGAVYFRGNMQCLTALEKVPPSSMILVKSLA